MNFSALHLNRTGICTLCVLITLLLIYSVRNKYSDSTNQLNLRHLLEVAIKSCENGGLEVVAAKDNLQIRSKGLTKEGAEDSVTTADFRSHCSMLNTLRASFPYVTIISEEAKTDCEEKHSNFIFNSNLLDKNLPDMWIDAEDITVWIDPLDATHEYTEKLYKFVTTMVCIAVQGEPIVGVIHKPFSKKTSWAWVGKAKSSDLVTQKNKNNEKKIIISRSHSGKIEEVLSKSLNNYHLIIAAGAGYKVLEVASGNVSAYLHITQIKKWDICAGNAILNAVGGRMTTKFNESIDYARSTNKVNENGLIATLDNHDTYLGKL